MTHQHCKCFETNSYHQQQDSGNWAFCFKLLNIEIRFVTILAGIHQRLRRQQAPAKPINGFNQYRPRHTNVFILCRSVSLIFPSLTRSCFHSQASQDPPGGACVTFPWTRWECQLASNLETKQWKHLVRQIQNNDNNMSYSKVSLLRAKALNCPSNGAVSHPWCCSFAWMLDTHALLC